MNVWSKKSSIRRRYDLTAEIYDQRYCEEQVIKYKTALSNLHVPSESFVIDVGCGSGLFFNHIAEKVKFVVGVDFSPKLLVQAKKQARRFDNIFLICADADFLPLKPNLFNFVFVFTVFQNLPNPLKTLSELKRISRNDSFFAIAALKHVVFLDGFEKILKKTGFSIVSFWGNSSLQCNILIVINSE